jgi:hypothetical protein
MMGWNIFENDEDNDTEDKEYYDSADNNDFYHRNQENPQNDPFYDSDFIKSFISAIQNQSSQINDTNSGNDESIREKFARMRPYQEDSISDYTDCENTSDKPDHKKIVTEFTGESMDI